MGGKDGPLLLTDAYLSVERVIAPHQLSVQTKNSTKVLRFLSTSMESRIFEVRSDQYLSDELADKLDGFASYPALDKHKRYFAEMVRLLAREPGTVIQQQVDALGWNTDTRGQLVWTMANGTETLEGFVAASDAATIAPEISSPSNGYYGSVATWPPAAGDTDFWDLLLNQYAPHEDVQLLTLSLLSLSALVQLPAIVAPEGIGIEDGTLRISPDIYGPSRHGKSRTLNAVLSLFGTRFLWNTNSIFSSIVGGDTKLGRNGTMGMLRYQLYVDRDHKSEPGHADFITDHKTRSDTIQNYVDGVSGGIRMRRAGGTERRATPAGCNVRTMNYDHAVSSIQQGDDMIENRACTFVWPDNERGDDAISVLLDQNRQQAYASGQQYRRWLMTWMHTPELLQALVSKYYDLARAATDGYEWHADYHRNHAVLLVLGALIFHRFLCDSYPSPWFAQWVDSRIMALVQNRVTRSLYIKSLIDQNAAESNVASFVMENLRAQLAVGSWYIRSQKDEALSDSYVAELPFSMQELGYRSLLREIDGSQIETWTSGQRTIGYLVHRGQDLAFRTRDLMNGLRKEAHFRGIALGTPNAFLSALSVAGMIVAGSAGHLQSIKIGDRSGWFLVIPAAILFVDADHQVGGDQTEENAMGPAASRPTEACPCGGIWTATVVARRFVWKCSRCATLHINEATVRVAGGVNFDLPPEEIEEDDDTPQYRRLREERNM